MVAELPNQSTIRILTGFVIPTSQQHAFETDGPLGALFLAEVLVFLGFRVQLAAEEPLVSSLQSRLTTRCQCSEDYDLLIAIERGGVASDGKRYSMKGVPSNYDYDAALDTHDPHIPSIAIGDGGNEWGMGRLPTELVSKAIPNGQLIQSASRAVRVILAGTSNWGAYALAAGVTVFMNRHPFMHTIFDADSQLSVLESLVSQVPLVDGVTGHATATVDGLTWEEYIQPLNTIRRVLEDDCECDSR
jgi:hypothetical protein